ncbi:MAG: secretin N-terminal domain-containing protein [Silanimonas sp.]
MPSVSLPIRVLSLAIAVGLSGCVSRGAPAIPEPLREPRQAPVTEPVAAAETSAESATRIAEGPRSEAPPVRVFDARSTPLPPGGRPISLALDSVRLSGFIDEVFANQLGLSIEMEQAVRDKADLVSLRLVQPETPSRVYEIAVEVLKRYGIAVVREQGRLRFAVQAGPSVDPPQMLAGRALPEVPAGQRPVFIVVPLQVANAGTVGGQLRALFADGGLKVNDILDGNALLLTGSPVLVNAALEAVQLFDRPVFRDKRSLRISPRYLAVEELDKELRAVMTAQGYSVKGRTGEAGALTFVPVSSANALIVFGESEEALAAVAQWVEELDQPGDGGEGRAGAYIYEARNTTVESLAPTVGALIGADLQGESDAASASTSDLSEERPASGSSAPTRARRRRRGR